MLILNVAAGKSFTMFGKDDDSIFGSSAVHYLRGESGSSSSSGIVPRACAEVMQAMRSRRLDNNIESRLSVSYVEIFGEYVSDLLRHGARCGNSKAASQGFVLTGQASQPVETLEDIFQLLQVGEAQKRRAATAMNERSTRAHAILILSLDQVHASSGQKKSSKLFLADLGGSEQVKKSKVDAGQSRLGVTDEFSAGFQLGIHMREAV